MGYFLCLGYQFCVLIPLTTIYARTGFSFGLNVLVELIIGYAIPGNGLALAFIKALGYNIDGQAQNFVNDLKQGHYAKLPPRAVYRVQLLSIFVASFIQLGILNFQLDGGIKDYCDPANPQRFTCPNGRTFTLHLCYGGYWSKESVWWFVSYFTILFLDWILDCYSMCYCQEMGTKEGFQIL